MKAMSIYQVEQFDLFDDRNQEIMIYQADITDDPDFTAPNEPVTKLRLITPDFHRKFSHIEIEHESKKTNHIRIKNEFYDLFFIKQSIVAFYNQDERVLLVMASKDLAREIVDRISKKFQRKFKLLPAEERKKFDFNKINTGADLINTWGAWFKNIGYSNVTSMALFGDHVQLSEKYEENIDNISSINVELSIDDEPITLIISKDLRIAVLTDATDAQMIDYYYVVKNLFD
jgi:hypothetical protein